MMNWRCVSIRQSTHARRARVRLGGRLDPALDESLRVPREIAAVLPQIAPDARMPDSCSLTTADEKDSNVIGPWYLALARPRKTRSTSMLPAPR